MNLDQTITIMAQHAESIRSLTVGISAEQARWKPDAEAWSMLEVVSHLYDEEREDFRVRLDYILHKPAEAWPPIDPKGWVAARNYAARDFQETIQNFLRERGQSLAWLKTFQNTDWEASATAPWGGAIKAGDMLASWVAHDMLHLRQLVELHWAYHLQSVKPYVPDYAGEW
jgi:hypothetical protein